jgi:glycosyltransferase involved in cell wall biosynthesis
MMNGKYNLEEKKKRVLLLNCHDDDVYCFRKEIIDELVAKDYHVILSCPYGERLKIFQKNNKISIEDIKINRRGKNPIQDLKLFYNYIKLMKKYKPNIVLTFTIKPNIYGSMAARILGIKYINNITGLGSSFAKKSLLNKIVVHLYRIALKKSSFVFFQNEENKNLALKEKMIKSKYKVIPGSGVNIEKFQLESYPKEETIVFNYIGRVLREKGIDKYIHAANKIKKEFKNVQFNIIGFIEPTEYHYKMKLEELQTKGIINYLGNQSDVRPFIKKSQCTIHPSMYGEGMSNVLLESAASGRPVITTNISGCKEVVADGITGFVYNADDVNDLIEKITKFLCLDYEDKKMMGIAGRKKIETEFNRDIVVQNYLHIIECELDK